jgi:tetratricopeptide (TPR) repeat protein
MELFLLAFDGADFGTLLHSLWDQLLHFAQTAVEAFTTADQVLGPAFRFVGAIVAFFSGVVAIYLKFHYAEGRLHLRFQEFLEREENRLALANRKLDDVMQRPGPSREVQSPIFTRGDVLPQLRDMKLGTFELRTPLQGRMRRAERELQDAIVQLEQQLALWNLQRSCYERKKVQAHLLKGAIAATRAASRKQRQEDDADDNLIALGEFKSATGVDPQKLQAFDDGAFDAFERADIQALEYVGHMHFRLGNPTLALQYFEKCESLADQMRPNQREGAMLRIRAFRHQAEILEWQNTRSSLDQARQRLSEAIRALPGDMTDSIEAAELLELRGRVQKKRVAIGDMNTTHEPRRDYTNAEQIYARIGTTEAEMARQRVEKERGSLPPDAPPSDGPSMGTS